MIDKLLQDHWGLDRTDLLKAIEVITRAGLLFVGATYGLGLVIVNAYLLRFGVFSVGLLRVEYVMAGMLWLFWLALGYGALDAAGRAWAKSRNRLSGKVGLWGLINMGAAALFALLSPFLLSGLLMGQQYDLSNRQIWLASGVVFYMAIFVPLILRTAKRVWSTPAKANDQADYTPFYASVIQAMFLLSALGLYSQYVYPLCLPMFGGGRPYSVQLTFVPAAIETLKQSGIDSAQDYQLISDSGEWLVIARADPESTRASAARRAIRLRRDLVALIVSSDGAKTR